MAVDWFGPWGNRVHIAPSLPDEHDRTEDAAEATNG